MIVCDCVHIRAGLHGRLRQQQCLRLLIVANSMRHCLARVTLPYELL